MQNSETSQLFVATETSFVDVGGNCRSVTAIFTHVIDIVITDVHNRRWYRHWSVITATLYELIWQVHQIEAIQLSITY